MKQIIAGWLSDDDLIHHRMELFHRERVKAIEGGDAPFRMKSGATLVVHLIPSESVRSPKQFPASDLKTHGGNIVPLGKESGRYRFNAEGYASYDGEVEIGAVHPASP